MNNLDRELVASVRRYCAAAGIAVQTHSHDWILELRRDGRVHHIFGYDLGLNTSTTLRICNDKAATWEILSGHNLPAIEHRIFLHPRWLDYIAVDGNWARMLSAFEGFGGDVVVKDNEGTGGKEVLRAQSVTELEQAVTTIFLTARSIALAPFLDIPVELRFVMLDGAPLLVYAKDRPVITGDGVRSVAELVADLALPPGVDQEILGEIAALHAAQSVPDDGEVLAVQWRHNLGKGAAPVIADPDDPRLEDALDLARGAAAALNLRFGSVDVALVEGAPQVLEVNSGVMLEHLCEAADEEGAALADRIYHPVLERVFAA